MIPLSRRTLYLISISTRRISIYSNSCLRIAHFSTSHNQYTFRRQDEEARNVRVSVWWDVESCNLPVGGSSAYRIGHSITAALRANGIKGPLQISAFGNVFNLPKLTQEALSSTGISLTHVPGGKDSVNRCMIIELMYWVSQHPPPGHIFLITGDNDMASTLHRLRMSNYNVLLAGPEDASTALCAAASIMWQWNTLVTGENLNGKHFNQPPDGPSGSWYGTYRVPLESPFPAVEQPLPARDSEPAEAEGSTVLDVPTEITEQIQQILATYPKGVSLTTLRRELNSNVIVDKKLYGYKNFYSLLSAMPQILELHRRGDGQHLVRAIKAKAHASTDSPMKGSENSTIDNINLKTSPIQIEVCDDNSSLKSVDEVCTLNSGLVANEKSKPIEPYHQSFSICSEQQPSLEEASQEPPTNDRVIEAGSDCGLEPTEKQDSASKDGILQRTWTKWFANANDADVKAEGNHSAVNGQSPDLSHISDAAPSNNTDKVETSDGGVGKFLELCSQVFYGFKTDSVDSETADAGNYSCNVSSQVAQHSLRNDLFSNNGFWTEMKSFMCTPKGANIVSKAMSRLEMARAMKNEWPSVLNSFDDDDLLHLVNLLIDDKKWIEECPSKASPFKVIGASVNLLGNSNHQNTRCSLISGEHQQSNLQKQIECGRPTNQIRSHMIESSEERKTRMLADVQKLLDAIVKSHPGGYNVSGFKKLFFERYCYCLQVRFLEFDKLTSLISTMSGVKLKGEVIFPSERSSSPPGSSDTDLLDDKNRFKQIESDNETSVPSRLSDSSDSQFDEQLGPVSVRRLNKNVPSSPSGNQKLKTEKERLLQYEPCAEDDIYTESDGEVQTREGHLKGGVSKAHTEVSTLIDILSNWEARKDSASKSSQLEITPKDDNLQNPIKTHSQAEVSRKSPRSTMHKWKPPRTINFVSDDHQKEVNLKNTTESGQQC